VALIIISRLSFGFWGNAEAEDGGECCVVLFLRMRDTPLLKKLIIIAATFGET
jgi:hypothetical protein